jgi:two-component system sensor histidine kinase QseC
MNSLRLRLLILLFVGLGVAWLVAAWFTHAESRKEIDRLFDAQLAQSAQVLLGTTRHELHERMESGDDEIPNSHEYEQKLAFQIWDNSDLLLRSSTAPANVMASNKEGYSDTMINSEPWRVITRWDVRHEFMIQVAEPMAARESLARHITLKLLIPSFIALPTIALLIWFGVGAGLKPLQQLSREVKQRTANRLEPVAMDGVPEEVAPLTQALNDLFSRLQQAFEGERRFTADAAHELRTPLAALRIQAQVALRSTDDSERHVALQNVLRGVDRSSRLVEQLLTLARVDPETIAINFKKVDLYVLALAAIADLAPLANVKQIKLTLEEGMSLSVLGDDNLLRLLLRNLLDNAIRYTPVGGRVTVTLHNIEGGAIDVKDSGSGIPSTEREKVLERFYRITGNGEEGSGLGLSIVRRISELHGTRLELKDNEECMGLLVRVTWPSVMGANNIVETSTKTH